ncbi:MAG: hypothetical protein FD177_420 [Desulfovibrionaceae bacterium]|nr:MAG: hypothetical protein FD177_420 [Desulfovibrionaceae bacterium]
MASSVKKVPYPSKGLLAISTHGRSSLRRPASVACHVFGRGDATPGRSLAGGLFPQVGPSRGNGLTDGFVPQGGAMGVPRLIVEATLR